MAHKQQEELESVITSIRKTQSLAKKKLSAIPNISNRIVNGLQQLDNFLSHFAGVPAGNSAPSKKFGPIQVERREPEAAPAVVNEKEVFRNELRKTRDAVWETFLDRPSDELLDSVDDIVLRAVAIKAGIPVTEENPDRLTIAFIDEIKQKIKANNLLKETLEQGQSDIENKTEPVGTKD